MNELRQLLELMVSALNQYNQPDMLNGYLDPLADEFNDMLEPLGLPTIERIDEEE